MAALFPPAPSPFVDGSLAAPRAWFGSTNHVGAKPDRARGAIINLLLDATDEVNDWTRLELLKKARVLYCNNGPVQRFVDGAAQMCGVQTPKATTSDEGWNELAEEAYREGTRHGVLDVAGKYSIEAAQTAAFAHTFKDGDFFAILTKSDTGRAQLAFYEGHQVGNNPDGGKDQLAGGWLDGVLPDRLGRPLKYRFLAGPPAPKQKREAKDYAAADVIAFIEYRRAGQLRGLSRLASAIPHHQDIDEILRFIKMGAKSAQMLALNLTNDAAPPDPLRGLASGLYKHEENGNAGDRPDKDSSTPEPEDDWINQAKRQINSQDAFDGGMFLDLPPNTKLNFDHDTRPHPDVLGGLDWILRHAAGGFGLPIEVVWKISELGGANTRYILADAAAWVDQRQRWLEETFLRRWWVYQMACEMEAGRLRPCKDPAWWRHAWMKPQRLTVDFSRDGKLYLTQLQSGNMTRARYYGLQQLDAEQEDKALIAEITKRKAWCSGAGLDYREVFPAPPQATALAPIPTSADPAPEPDTYADPAPYEQPV